MEDRLNWDRDGHDWPNRDASSFVEAAGTRWHVQRMGAGPPILLVHGTGSSTHSWRDLAPILAKTFSVVAIDLPGHGFTQTPASGGLTLPGMANGVRELMTTLNIDPVIAVGHSAGAAILIKARLDGLPSVKLIISINGALLPYGGAASRIFSPLAKLLFLNPFVPSFFARRANDRLSVSRLLEGTGSKIDERGIKLYARLFRSSKHVASTLGMMASWDLTKLVGAISTLDTRLVLVTAAGDKSIAPRIAFGVRDLVPGATVEFLREGGHLVHEENPGLIADLIIREARKSGILPPSSQPVPFPQ